MIGPNRAVTVEPENPTSPSLGPDPLAAGLCRARSAGKRLGRSKTTPFTVQRIRRALDEERGVRETARLLKVSAAKVSEGHC
jgi:hypothetical protein